MKSFFVLIIFCFCIQQSAFAQQLDINQATKESNHPLSDNFKNKITPAHLDTEPQIQQSPPKVSQGQLFFFNQINLEGVQNIPMKEFQPLLTHYENRQISLTDIHSLIRQIEGVYIRHGFIAACIIPPQKINQGQFILQVIEARMGKLHIGSHKYFNNARIEYYWKVKENEPLNYAKIRESMYLINKNPDRASKVILSKGETPQTTDVTVETQTHFPVHYNYNFDNEGATSTGKYRYTFGAQHNNFLGLDDFLMSGYNLGHSFHGVFGYHFVPINKYGTSMIYGYNHNVSAPKKEFAPLEVKSLSTNTTLGLNQDIFHNGDYWGNIATSFDTNDKTLREDTGIVSRDRLRVFRNGLTKITKTFSGISIFAFNWSQGVNGFGAVRKNSLSSRSASNTFTKFNLDFKYKRALFPNLEFLTQMKSQGATQRLAPQEAFYLGGLDSVRGYPSGDFLADDGITSTIELLARPGFFSPALRIPFSHILLRDSIVFVGFFDYGWGAKRSHLSEEKATTNMLSAGPGIRIRPWDNILLRFEWGFPFGDKPATENGHSQFHFSINFSI